MTETKQEAAPRRRDATATRRAFLDAARAEFAKNGYDNAGLRDIAQRAGADPRLIGRYFGSKEKLFAEVVDEVYRKPLLMTPDVSHEAAVALLGGPEAVKLDGLLLTLRSAASERAAAIMLDSIERNYETALAGALDGPDAVGRAALLISICAGVQLQRNILGSTVLNDEVAVRRLVPYLRAALDAVSIPLQDQPRPSAPRDPA